MLNFFKIQISIQILVLAVAGKAIAQDSFNYMPAKIGWHQAQYDDKKHPNIVPWTTWDDALEREMKWYLRAPINEYGYPSFVHITFMDEKYQSYRDDIIPATAKTPDGKTKQVVKDFFSKPKNGNTYVVAHRGVHENIPENTLAGYQKAIDLGCDFVEIDLRKTKDGRFVSVHNETIDAYVSGKTGKVGDFTLAELKQLNIGKRVGPGWENERIPTFEEILQLCSGQIGIYLDLKEPDVKAQIEIIKSFGMERDIIWYIPASSLEVIKEVQENCFECIVMPDPGSKENIVALADEVRPKVIATDMGELNAEYMEIAKDLKIKVIVDEKQGTVEEWDAILKLGVEGIQTDHVEKLINYLKNKKQ